MKTDQQIMFQSFHFVLHKEIGFRVIYSTLAEHYIESNIIIVTSKVFYFEIIVFSLFVFVFLFLKWQCNEIIYSFIQYIDFYKLAL